MNYKSTRDTKSTYFKSAEIIKKGLAEAATASGINEVTQKKAAAAYHKAEELKAQQALAASLNGKTVVVKMLTEVKRSMHEQRIATKIENIKNC